MRKNFEICAVILLSFLIMGNYSKGNNGSNSKTSEQKSKDRGQLFVIGTGPAGPQMSTVQALETIKEMDVIAAPMEHAQLFKDYIKGKTVLFDPWKGLFDYKGKNLHRLTKEEMGKFRAERFRIRDKRVNEIKKLLDQGKGTYIFRMTRGDLSSEQQYRLAGYLYRENDKMMFLLASLVQLKKFWGIDNGLSASEKVWNLFIDEEVLPNFE